MNRIDRLFGILTFLQSKKYVPAERIAEKFHISVRTVYRDVKALCEGGIPVSFEPGRGYFVVQGYFLPPVSFSTEEANALLLMETMVKGFADKSIHTHYSSALQKVKAVLRSSQKEKVEFLQSNIKLQMPACMINDYDYLSVLQMAISQKVIIQMEYKNNKSEVSKRRIEPIGLVFYAFSWHLIAWCQLRQEYRDFKVARILKVNDTSEPFSIQEHPPLADYLKQLPVAH
ncbi:MAG TPA: YafY family protein [Flavisolibacter sp.]|jgi:predicted DNA-binding transcriptional regulator YafY